MERLDVSKLSGRYAVRALTQEDIPEICALGRSNPQFEAYCGASMTEESIKNDMAVVPPGKRLSDKYYVGFFDGSALTAVLDLIAGYPDDRTAFIGFFMVHGGAGGHGVGTAIIGDICHALVDEGFLAVRLAYEKTNPQATRFWNKNGFRPVREVHQDGGDYIVADKKLQF